jgi:hypothetical protein
MLPGFLATMRVLTSVRGRSSLVVHQSVRSPDADAISGARVSLASNPKSGLFTSDQRPGHGQLSLLIAFELRTIPPPTTLLPFRHDRFYNPLRHRRGSPRLSPWLTQGRRDLPSRGIGFEHS